jgi:hypothetical protein
VLGSIQTGSSPAMRRSRADISKGLAAMEGGATHAEIFLRGKKD